MELNQIQKTLAKRLTNSFLFTTMMFFKLPMGWLAGIRVREISGEKCVTSVPFKRLNKNPFRSTYFAVQSMAAELSTAAGCMVALKV